MKKGHQGSRVPKSPPTPAGSPKYSTGHAPVDRCGGAKDNPKSVKKGK